MRALDRLMLQVGIEPEFEDASGNTRKTDPAVAADLLRALGHEVRSEPEARAALDRLSQEAARRLLPPVITTTRPGARVSVPLTRRVKGDLRWEIIAGDAPAAPVLSGSEAASGRAASRLEIDAPPDAGWYRLRVDGAAALAAEAPLLVAPASCWTPKGLGQDRRIWGVSLQLYLMRSARNWGIGDFTDLEGFVDIAADLGADVVGVNPLHAMFPDAPSSASPYSPASRLFLNMLYIDPVRVPGYEDAPGVRRIVETPEFRERLVACREADLIDYDGVAALKFPVLEALHGAFRSRGAEDERAAFGAFRHEQGQELERFCRFLALRERFAAEAPDRADWRHWPEAYRDCRSAEVERFAAEHATRVEFFAWAQWIADRQLASAAERTRARGMAIGLYRDLAVGSDAGAAEGWSNPGIVLSSLQVGAPPDFLNPVGQNWGLPPFSPEGLRHEAYASFAELVRTNMRHAGGLRIDHVMALLHLYMIPEGRPPNEGAYVGYPLEDLLAVLALESRRQGCLVVGEDLGTVPEGFRDRMTDARVLSYRVVFFERDEDGAFVPPDAYPPLALAVLGSHDLATLHGWWDARDIDLKARHGLYADAGEQALQREERAAERRAFLAALGDAGLDVAGLSAEGPFTPELAVAAHGFLARTRSGLAVAQLDDLLDEIDQVNLPGTVNENPNWRRRHQVPLERIAAHPAVRAQARALRR